MSVTTHRTTHRKPLPLDDEQLLAVASARTPGTALNEALTEMAGLQSLKSEAATLNAIFQLGLRVLDDLALDHAYREIAAQRAQDPETAEYQQAVRNRGSRRSTIRD